MVTSKIRVVLQGIVKYRDGKKWKKRFCLLALSPKTADALHLYVAKSDDDFTPYRNDGCMVDVQVPPFTQTLDFSDALSDIDVHRGYVIPESATVSQDNVPGVQPMVNTATQSCLIALQATSSGLSAAASLASRLNAPSPVDEITGFESGYHMDKESNIIALIGISSVYVIALQSTDEMFRWAAALSQIVTDKLFRVTLRKSSEGSKLSHGIQGSMHVQHWRLCLIGEPSAGCRFICSWKLDSVEQAYMISTQTSVTSALECQPTSGVHKSIGDLAHRISSGSVSSSHGSVGLSSSGDHNKPKDLFVLETNSSAAKGRGTHTFEVDGGSPEQLIPILDGFLNRRYNHGESFRGYGLDRTLSEYNERPSVHSLNAASNFDTRYECAAFQPSYRAVGNPPPIHSFCALNSPNQNLSFTSGACRSSPVIVPAIDACSVNDRTAVDQCTFGQSVPALPSNRFSCPVPHYSNLLPSTFSFSLSGVPSDSSRRIVPVQKKQHSGLEGSDQQQNRCGSAFSFPRVKELHSYFNHVNSCCNPPRTSTPISESSQTATVSSVKSHTNSFRSSSNCADLSTVSKPLLDDTQVVRVPAGLIISKRPATAAGQKAIVSSPAMSHRDLLKPRIEALPTSTSCVPPYHASCRGFENSSALLESPDQQKLCPLRMRCIHVTRHKPWALQKRHISADPTVTASQSDPNSHIVPSNSFGHHGVFVADEDLSETELLAGAKMLEKDKLHRVGRAIQEYRCVATSVFSKPPLLKDPSLRTTFCDLCETGLRELKPYRVYRHRHRQYRSCICFPYVGRCLSSDLLFRLRIGCAPISSIFRDSGPSDDCSCVIQSETNCNQSPTQLGIVFDCQTNPTHAGFSKTFGGSRWGGIHRLFNKKQSKSHDNLQNHGRFSERQQSISKGAFFPTTATEYGIEKCEKPFVDSTHVDDKRTAVDRDSVLLPPQSSRTGVLTRCRLIVQCPRHGLDPYHPWLRNIHTSTMYPVCPQSRLRKETAVTPQTKDVHNCSCHEPNASVPPGFSVVSALRSLVHSKQKTQGKGLFSNKISIKRKVSAPLKESPSLPVSETSPVCIAGSTNWFQSSKLSNPGVCVDLINLLRLDDASFSPVEPPRTHNNRFSQCTFPDYERLSGSLISLTSVACSEPSISRSMLPFRRFSFGQRSLHSSLSSLLTSHSVSDSSSLLSASHVNNDTHSKRIFTSVFPRTSLNPADASGLPLRDTIDRLEDMRRSSICDTDELSSGSLSICFEDTGLQHRRPNIHGDADVMKNLFVDCSTWKAVCSLDSCPPTSQVCLPCESSWQPSVPYQVSSKVPLEQPVFENGTRVECTCLGAKPNTARIDRRCTHLKEVEKANDCFSYSQRANTLPNTKVFCNSSDCDKSVHASLCACHSVIPSDSSKTLRRSKDPSCSKPASRFSRRGRRNTRYNTAMVTSATSGSVPLDRKLSCQPDLCSSSNSSGSATNLEPVNYCNLKPTLRNAKTVPTSSNGELSPRPDSCRSHQFLDVTSTDPCDPCSQSIYVNLPPSAVQSDGSRSGGRVFHHVLRAVHHPGSAAPSIPNLKVVAVQSPNSSSFVGVLEPGSYGKVQSAFNLRSTMGTHKNPNHVAAALPNPTLHTCGTKGYPGLLISATMSDLPAEVRDPSRNYAMVDLRPSPASSVNANAQLTLNVIHHPNELKPTDSADSSVVSAGFSNSTSTGSDCTSDAATLTSDTLGSYTAVSTASATCASVGIPSPAGRYLPTRRRHSHSLSLVGTEFPILNYVHVIASNAPLTALEAAPVDVGCTPSDPINYSVLNHEDSPTSSSGLGGLASQSITPPLATTGNISVGDVFTSRSMTSSATSSGEGNPADGGFQSYSPLDDDCVAYTQIDFTRTFALGEVRGDMDLQEYSGSGKASHSSSSKVDRSTSVRKTLSRPIRSIRRVSQKKSDS